MTNAYRDVLDPSSPWFEKCARHQGAQAARNLQYIHLCDPCARRLVHEGFNDRPFIYHGETIEGYCGLCNRLTDVTLRQAFVCPMCWTVVIGYQKGIVAAQAVADIWEAKLKPRFPSLRLQETEVLRIEPYVRGAKTKKQAALTLDVLDYHVFESSRGGVENELFHIEVKSGPASIDGMKEFQLDVNDYDDVLGATCQTGLPAYLFHVQVRSEYHVPTRRMVGEGVWWTDLCQLRENLIKIAPRRDGDKNAAYFKRTAFKPIGTFGDELRARGFDKLRDQIDRQKLALPAPTPRPKKAPKGEPLALLNEDAGS